MRVKRVLCIVLSLAAVFSLLLIRDSAAWINTSSGDPLSGTVTARKLNFDFAGTLGSYLSEGGVEYILPGQNLIIDNGGQITGVNYSTIDTEIRFQVKYATPSNASVVCASETGEDLEITVGTDFSGHCSGGWWYYNGSGGFAATNGNGTPFVLLQEIKYSESITKEAYRSLISSTNTTGTVSVVVQAKQKGFADWTDIAAFNA